MDAKAEEISLLIDGELDGETVERAAKVDCRCPFGLRRAPWDGCIERPINLEGPQSVLEVLHLSPVKGRQVGALQPQNLARREVDVRRR